MSMQVNPPFIIKLIFRNTYKFTIMGFSLYSTSTKDYPSFKLTDAISYYGKPIAFELIKLNINSSSLKLIHWLQTEFKDLFDLDPLLWFASVGTMPVELHQYLIPFHSESKES